jgi:hypothetical protein
MTSQCRDKVLVTKSIIESVTTLKTKTRKTLILRVLQFKDVVPSEIVHIIVSLFSNGKNRLSYYIIDNLIIRLPCLPRNTLLYVYQ